MNYLFEIITAALICGLLTKIPPGISGKLNGYIKYIATLAFLIVLVTPIMNNYDKSVEWFSDLSSISDISIDDKDSESGQRIENLNIISNEICKSTAKSAAEYFKVSEKDFKIKLITSQNEKGEFGIKEIIVYPKGDALKVGKSSLKKYFENIFKSPTEVVVKIE